MPIFRILVVEDHGPVRQFICSVLEQRPEFHLVGEAVDGLEAVRLGQELQPDLILLDIGLPKLNGLEAGRQLRQLVPDAKLLFLSLESLPGVVQEAFRLGARGYVHKMRAQLDLLPAIDAVLAGSQFVSSDVAFAADRGSQYRHEVQFYSDDYVFLERMSRFVGSALAAGNPAIVLVTKAHQEGLVQKLKAEFDIDRAIREGTYIYLDALEVMSRVMASGAPDLARLRDGLINLIEAAAMSTKTDFPRVALCGECAPQLCMAGDIDGTVQIEQKASEVIRTRNVDLLCAYPLSAFHRQADARAFTRVCAEHTAVYSH